MTPLSRLEFQDLESSVNALCRQAKNGGSDPSHFGDGPAR
jgi:hypothetical protein